MTTNGKDIVTDKTNITTEVTCSNVSHADINSTCTKTDSSKSIFTDRENFEKKSDEINHQNVDSSDYNNLPHVGSAVSAVVFVVRYIIVLPIAIYISLILFPVLAILKVMRWRKAEYDFDNTCYTILEAVEEFRSGYLHNNHITK